MRNIHVLRSSDDIKLLSKNLKSMEYILAGNGLFLFKENLVCKVLYSISKHNIPEIPTLTARCVPTTPKIPYSILEPMIEFGRHGIKEGYGEVMMYLKLSEDGVWSLTPPLKQENSTAGVTYSPNPAERDIVGTIHTHPGAAFFSATDDADDMFGFAGIHGVLGNLGRENPEMEWSITVGKADGVRFLAGKDFELDLLVEVPPEKMPYSLPEVWLNTLNKKSYGTGSWQGKHNYARPGTSLVGFQPNKVETTSYPKTKETEKKEELTLFDPKEAELEGVFTTTLNGVLALNASEMWSDFLWKVAEGEYTPSEISLASKWFSTRGEKIGDLQEGTPKTFNPLDGILPSTIIYEGNILWDQLLKAFNKDSLFDDEEIENTSLWFVDRGKFLEDFSKYLESTTEEDFFTEYPLHSRSFAASLEDSSWSTDEFVSWGSEV